MKIETKELTPRLWSDFEKLFGPRGACGGCWCMYWRIDKGEKWDNIKGEPARRRLHRLVIRGEAQGLLAYIDGEPVGWATFGPRSSFSRLNRAPSLSCEDADEVWAVPCFYVKTAFRGQRVASALLKRVLQLAKKNGVKIVEGYPVQSSKNTRQPIPAAFAWTGTVSLFEKAGFTAVVKKKGGKLRMRKSLST
jgi:GNAT superfamily N-acetyltransferase